MKVDRRCFNGRRHGEPKSRVGQISTVVGQYHWLELFRWGRAGHPALRLPDPCAHMDHQGEIAHDPQ